MRSKLERVADGLRFAAIDFEIANLSYDSACALAVVRVEGNTVVERRHWLIRPPTSEFSFSYVHGIRWSDVRLAPTFVEVWAQAIGVIAGASFLAAHNALFDRFVLIKCCETAGVPPPIDPFCCTVQLARRFFRVHPTTLPNVCRRLGIPLRHHEALSDAEACARIVLEADRRGRKGLE